MARTARRALAHHRLTRRLTLVAFGAAIGGLTSRQRHASVFDMATTTTTREFIRHFARLKKAAANGDEVMVRDRQGQLFVFRAKGTGPSLGEQLSDLRGALRTGKSAKSLHGFGRNRA